MVAADHNGALQTTALNRKLKILVYFEAVYIVVYFEADINGLPFCFFDFKVDEMNAKRKREEALVQKKENNFK